MAYWLFKSEPDTWGWDQQVAKGDAGEEWHGVRNYQARNNMRAMKVGDLGFFYHSNVGKEIVGIVEVSPESAPDSTTDDPRWDCVCDPGGAAVETAGDAGGLQGAAGAGGDGAGQQHAAVGAAGDGGGMADRLRDGRSAGLNPGREMEGPDPNGTLHPPHVLPSHHMCSDKVPGSCPDEINLEDLRSASKAQVSKI